MGVAKSAPSANSRHNRGQKDVRAPKFYIMGKARSVYFKNEKLWERLEQIAAHEDRSVNYILEKMVELRSSWNDIAKEFDKRKK